VRARLRPLLPALTRFYGLEPEAWERMSGFEVDEYVGQWRDATRRQNSEVTRGPQ
jgi:hypothetical protein